MTCNRQTILNMNTITIKDKKFKKFISAEEIDAIVGRVAKEIDRDYADLDLVACPVLTGAFMFASDLVRHITIPCEVRFVRYASYSGMSSTGEVKCQLPFPSAIEGRDVLIVEDVVDSGFSMKYMLQAAEAMHPRSVRICSLFFKPHAFKGDYKVNYVGKEIGDEFIVGYGLDYNEHGRTLKDLWVVAD